MIKYRSAKLNDIDAIMRIERLSFLQDTQENEQVYLQRIKTFPEGFILMLNDEKIIGCVCSEIWIKESLCIERFSLNHDILTNHRKDGNQLYISSIAIDPAFRNRGYGKSLLQYLFLKVTRQFPNIDSLILLLNEDWKAAHTIYLKEGFSEVARFTGFFGGQHEKLKDGIVMEKLLSKKI